MSDIITVTPEATTESAVQQELSRYLGDGPVVESPLEWWKVNQKRYPTLSRLAKKYLATPATSVPSERIFSHGGHIVNTKRSCLLADVSTLLFLSENL